MRTTADRIRHALCFELFGFLLVLPLGTVLFELSIKQTGLIGIVSALIATLWVYGFNVLFDLSLLRRYGSISKNLRQRILNALLFEAGLLLVLLPFISLYLNISLWQALQMDIALAAFYLVYAFVYNWTYDYLFPLPLAQ